jgi:hypothetical protein
MKAVVLCLALAGLAACGVEGPPVAPSNVRGEQAAAVAGPRAATMSAGRAAGEEL